MSSARWVGFVVALGVVSVVAPIPAVAQGVIEATATAIAPARGPIEGGTPVTVSGTGFAPGATRVQLITEDGRWKRDVPASAVTVNTVGTEASFVMPKGPSKGGQVGAVVYTPSGRAEGTPIFEYPPPAAVTLPVASGMAPTTGQAGTVVTITGTAFGDGVYVLLESVRTGWETRLMPAVLTFDEEETAVSFTMPEMPNGGGPVNVFVMYRGIRPANGLRFDYASSTGPQARVATDATDGVAPSSSSDTSWLVLFAIAMGALVAGWAVFVVATRRRSTRTT